MTGQSADGGPPRWAEPELATLTRDYFSDPAWIFERKLDGERCLGFADSSGISEWTDDGELRHPRFQGLRDDKDPAEVVREVPS